MTQSYSTQYYRIPFSKIFMQIYKYNVDRMNERLYFEVRAKYY
jgi:hypothetical protein